jgi:hypothetical protein
MRENYKKFEGGREKIFLELFSTSISILLSFF